MNTDVFVERLENHMKEDIRVQETMISKLDSVDKKLTRLTDNHLFHLQADMVATKIQLDLVVRILRLIGGAILLAVIGAILKQILL